MNRFDVVLGHYVFCVLNHSGQSCPLYARLCRILKYFNPGALFSETAFFDSSREDYDGAREVYYKLKEFHAT